MGVVDVQQIALARIRIGDMTVRAHPFTLEIEGPEPVSGENIIAQYVLPIVGYVFPIVVAQCTTQGRTRLVWRVHRLAVQIDETQPGQRKNTQSGLNQGIGQSTRKCHQAGQGHLPQQMNEG